MPEPKLGGRLFESFETGSGSRVKGTGRITCWEPPARFVFDWRAVNLAPDEKTEVEVSFGRARAARWSRCSTAAGARSAPITRSGTGETRAFGRSMGLWWGSR